MTDLETAIMIKNMARETVRRMSARAKNADEKRPYMTALALKYKREGVLNTAAKNAEPKYTVIDGTVWYEDDEYKFPLETFRGKNKKFIKGSIEEEIKAGHPSAKRVIQNLGEYYKKRK